MTPGRAAGITDCSLLAGASAGCAFRPVLLFPAPGLAAMPEGRLQAKRSSAEGNGCFAVSFAVCSSGSTVLVFQVCHPGS